MSDSDNVITQFEFAVQLHTRGRLVDALLIYDAIIAEFPTVPIAHGNRGAALLALNRPLEALASYDRAIALNSTYAEAHNNRGIALQHLGRLGEALECFARAIILAPSYAEAYYNRGANLQAMNDLPAALESYDAAIACKAEYAEAYNNRGIVLQKMRRTDAALQSYDQAIRANPVYAEAYNNKGALLLELKRFDESRECLDRAIEIKADFAEAYNNRGNLHERLNRHEAALKSYDKAIELGPIRAQIYCYNKGLCLLALGCFEEGFLLFENRPSIAAGIRAGQEVRRPGWLTNGLASGRTLFIRHEFLLGDVIQFCRYAPIARSMGYKVILSAPASLHRLLRSLDSAIELASDDSEPQDVDSVCSLMSLPLAFGTTLGTVPCQVPYLRAEPRLVEKWRNRIGMGKFRIGVCWQGSDEFVAEGRAFRLLEVLEISKLQNVQLISLQIGKGSEQLGVAAGGMNVMTLGDDFDAGPDAFIDAAAAMESLDLVITSDTAMAHLAGALGRPVWVALKHAADWRWLIDRVDSPWYPTMTLFRQPSEGDWRGAFSNMKAKLVALVAPRQDEALTNTPLIVSTQPVDGS